MPLDFADDSPAFRKRLVTVEEDQAVLAIRIAQRQLAATRQHGRMGLSSSFSQTQGEAAKMALRTGAKHKQALVELPMCTVHRPAPSPSFDSLLAVVFV